ncbi:MAG: PH domain-containing protein [Lysobacteraceae bacterium]
MTETHSEAVPTPVAPVDDDGFRPLPDAALSSARLGGLIRALLLGGGLGLAFGLILGANVDIGIGQRLLLILFGILGWGLPGWFWQRAAWRRTRYRVDDDGWHVRRGVLWRSETLVPRSRVQHVDVNHGPVDRHFGLASLKVHTAGTRMEAVTLHRLLEADALALRDRLLDHHGNERDDDAV